MNATEDNITFGCVTTGYPNVQLVVWQTGLGASLAMGESSEITTWAEKSEFSTTLSSILSVADTRTCGRAWGYTCVFRNGGTLPFVERAFTHCPEGILILCSCVLSIGHLI